MNSRNHSLSARVAEIALEGSGRWKFVRVDDLGGRCEVCHLPLVFVAHLENELTGRKVTLGLDCLNRFVGFSQIKAQAKAARDLLELERTGRAVELLPLLPDLERLSTSTLLSERQRIQAGDFFRAIKSGRLRVLKDGQREWIEQMQAKLEANAVMSNVETTQHTGSTRSKSARMNRIELQIKGGKKLESFSPSDRKFYAASTLSSSPQSDLNLVVDGMEAVKAGEYSQTNPIESVVKLIGRAMAIHPESGLSGGHQLTLNLLDGVTPSGGIIGSINENVPFEAITDLWLIAANLEQIHILGVDISFSSVKNALSIPERLTARVCQPSKASFHGTPLAWFAQIESPFLLTPISDPTRPSHWNPISRVNIAAHVDDGHESKVWRWSGLVFHNEELQSVHKKSVMNEKNRAGRIAQCEIKLRKGRKLSENNIKFLQEHAPELLKQFNL
jgi:hypothetical protein